MKLLYTVNFGGISLSAGTLKFEGFFLLYTILASYNVSIFILKQHHYNLYTVNQLLLSQF